MARARLAAVSFIIAAISLIGTDAFGQLNGVLVDPQGVLRLQTVHDPGGRLTATRMVAARRALDQNIVRRSDLRKVSLNRLEAAVADRLAEGKQPAEEMLRLAGLTRVKHVFFYPETNDIVLAGPAEGWFTDLTGRTVGINSGRPILELQDLIVALRAFGPTAVPDPLVSISIDPTQEGLARMQQFLRNLRGIRPSDESRIVQGLRTSMGLQNIVVNGVSPKTHFARVLIEADYRMKLIGIGLERPPVKITTYISRAGATSASKLQRWYFVPDYECVRVTDDGLAMEMEGDAVRLLCEDQVVAADGSRRKTGVVDRASLIYAQSFTKNYGRLAAKSPLWAQMRNCIDLAVAAAFIREQGFFEQAGWRLGIFGDENAYAVETHETPVHVETVVNSVWKGNLLMTPVGGGVRVQATQALEPRNMLTDDDQQVAAAREAINPAKVDANSWWWD